jgi:hypothetical protein
MAGTIVSDTLQDGAGNSTATTNAIKGSAKAWVNFNATGPSIYSSFNVSSITYNAAGNFNINFTTAMGNTNYAYSVSVSADGNISTPYLNGSKTSAIQTSYLNVASAYYIGAGSWAASNPTSVSVVIFSS